MGKRSGLLFFIILLVSELFAVLLVTVLRFTTHLQVVREWRFIAGYAVIMLLCSVSIFCVVHFVGRISRKR